LNALMTSASSRNCLLISSKFLITIHSSALPRADYGVPSSAPERRSTRLPSHQKTREV
jgi:hypothetical protein